MSRLTLSVMTTCRDSRSSSRAYCDRMARAALLTAGLLALAACSGGDEAEPPPLETVAPTTTLEPAPTTEAPETATSAPPATTVAATDPTTTETPTTDSATTDPEAAAGPSGDEPEFSEAFEVYEVAWRARRDAVASPDDETIRSKLAAFYSESALAPINQFLDDLAESDLRAQPNVESPSRVEFVRGESLSTDGEVVGMTICEVLTDIGIDRATGEVVRTQTDAFLNQVFLVRIDTSWVVDSETTVTQFPEQETCQ